MADDWLHDAARRAKAARVDPTMPNPARVGDALSGGRNAISDRQMTLRSRGELAGLLTHLDLVPPGLVPITEWRPEADDPVFEHAVPVYGAVARKP
jgi:hypothetical protein